MAEKTEDELRAEQAAYMASAAGVERQLAAIDLAKVQAFVDALAARITVADVQALEGLATGLPDFSGRYAANLIDLLKATPGLMAMEVEKLQRAATPPAPPPTPAPSAS